MFRYGSCCSFLVLFFALFPSACLAWPAKVISVPDGDTIIVLHSGVEEKIRLYGIDTPEKDQEYGQKAKELTNAMLSGRDVDIQTVTADDYGRTVGLVSVDGYSLNGLIVQNGYAWVYRQHCKKRLCSDWIKLESEARKQRKGLWAGSNIVPPWEWRKNIKVSWKEKPEHPDQSDRWRQESEPPLILIGKQSGSGGGFRCDGRTYCSQMGSCAEATFFIQNCPGTKMDGNGDGVPCEKQWCR